MRFIVHVIEEISIHKKNEEDVFDIIKCEVEDGKEGHIYLSDSFYTVDSAETEIDAVIEITNIIRVEDEDGDRVKLAYMLKRQKELKDSDKEKSNRLNHYINKYIVSDNTNSELFSSTYEIERTDDNKELCVELHKLFFYVIKENKIMHMVEK